MCYQCSARRTLKWKRRRASTTRLCQLLPNAQPVVVTDCNAYGALIFLTYYCGSRNMIMEHPGTNMCGMTWVIVSAPVRHAHWAGIRPNEGFQRRPVRVCLVRGDTRERQAHDSFCHAQRPARVHPCVDPSFAVQAVIAFAQAYDCFDKARDTIVKRLNKQGFSLLAPTFCACLRDLLNPLPKQTETTLPKPVKGFCMGSSGSLSLNWSEVLLWALKQVLSLLNRSLQSMRRLRAHSTRPMVVWSTLILICNIA